MNEGYIKAKIGGKERSLKFNMRAMEAFTEIKNQGTRIVSASVTLVYAGLVGWYYAKQLEPDFTFSDVIDWVEDLIFSGQQSVLTEIDKCFQDSKTYKHFVSKDEPTEDVEPEKKKASPGRKYTHSRGGK